MDCKRNVVACYGDVALIGYIYPVYRSGKWKNSTVDKLDGTMIAMRRLRSPRNWISVCLGIGIAALLHFVLPPLPRDVLTRANQDERDGADRILMGITSD